jgi:thiol-disulfide isomerase/thioredoxin
VTATPALPIEGRLPELGGATAWLHSEPLTPAGLRGKVVVVQFCTFSCINWLRTLPYVKAWVEKYRDEGLVVIGAHSPEFPFEHDLEKIRSALDAMGVGYPIAVDNHFAVWRAFDNAYWPALYFADAQGRIRHHHFGEEDYERSERVIQQLLAEAGSDDSPPTGTPWNRRRPTPATRGPPASPHRGASNPTAAGPTSSRRSSSSTTGRSPAPGRWGTRSRP